MKSYYFINKETLKKGLAVHPSNHVVTAKNKKEAIKLFRDTFSLDPKKYECRECGK